MSTKSIQDHNGNIFNSIKEMCEYYQIPYRLYNDRKKNGWSLEKILTTPTHHNKCIDHKGNEFDSLQKMCDYYHISYSIYYDRKNKGWDLEKILTEPIISYTVSDHKGNEFDSLEKMCDYYHISRSIYFARLKRGWDLEKILTEPIMSYNVFDHTGREFESIHKMCDFWNLNVWTYSNRKKNGWDLERILTTPEGNYNQKILILDPITQKESSIKELSEKYNVPKCNIQRCIRLNNNLAALLGISIKLRAQDMKFSDCKKYNLLVSKRIKKGKDVFECYILNDDGTKTFKIMSYDMIDEYCIEQYKKLNGIK